MRSKKILLAAALSAGLFSATSALAGVSFTFSPSPHSSIAAGSYLTFSASIMVDGIPAGSDFEYIKSVSLAFDSGNFQTYSILFNDLSAQDFSFSHDFFYGEAVYYTPSIFVSVATMSGQNSASICNSFSIALGLCQEGQENQYSAAYYPNVTVSPQMAAPVPESETYAMLLAGLGLLSFTARRRKRGA